MYEIQWIDPIKAIIDDGIQTNWCPMKMMKMIK